MAQPSEKPLLIINSSPHMTDLESIPRIMYSVLLALVPAALASVYFFGPRALWIMTACMISAVAAEAVFQRARRKPVTVYDGSALITGLLLAMNLPPGIPLWMGAVGSVVAICLGKQVFGGLGFNPFNPALIGRAFLAAAFPVQMTQWVAPFDGTSAATPLALAKMQHVATPYLKLFLGNVGGSLGETSALALLIGAAFLLYRGYIDWRIPTGMLGSVAVLSLLLGQDPVFHLLAGGLMLGAFFMATDMVTSPVTTTGRWIFGIGAGIITVVIRVFGAYPEGVSYSILIMNGFAPLINMATRPRVFGEVRKHA